MQTKLSVKQAFFALAGVTAILMSPIVVSTYLANSA